MAGGRIMVSDSPAWTLSKTGLSALQDVARTCELVNRVDNGTYYQQFFFSQRREGSDHMWRKTHGSTKVSEKKEGEEVLQTSESKFLCKP